jgi:pSer/pThr/pTyr-binding forkhead associated (FHA) protein
MSHFPKQSDAKNATIDALPKGIRRQAMLTVVRGLDLGAQFKIVDSVTVGSALSATALVRGEGVDPEHARVWCTASGAFMLEDLGSQMGTFVNDVPVARRLLALADRIRLWPDVTLEIRF